MAAPAPDKHTLKAFTPKAAGEIERNKFAATTGGLVNLSASTYWELFYAAQAWHEHLALGRADEAFASGDESQSTQSATAS